MKKDMKKEYNIQRLFTSQTVSLVSKRYMRGVAEMKFSSFVCPNINVYVKFEKSKNELFLPW